MEATAERRPARVSIAYDGEAVRDGSMDVQQLAPALLAVSDLFKAANKATNGEQAALSVRVQAEFGKGSFIIDLAVQLETVVVSTLTEN